MLKIESLTIHLRLLVKTKIHECNTSTWIINFQTLKRIIENVKCTSIIRIMFLIVEIPGALFFALKIFQMNF